MEPFNGSEDEVYMRRALELALRGRGRTAPNPMVGAVLVLDGRIIGEGAHELFGGPHAEVNAITDSGGSAKGACLYVTLEPCDHQGKTPPCTQLLIRSGISRVVIAMADPNPQVSGRGIARLTRAGIPVRCGVLAEEAKILNRPYIRSMTRGRPYVLLKMAMTLDGKIAAAGGASRGISGRAAFDHVHGLRHRFSAIMTGIGTVLCDDPALTARSGAGAHPIPVIVDSAGRIPLNAQVLSKAEERRPIIAMTEAADPETFSCLEKRGCRPVILPSHEGRVDLDRLMDHLAAHGIDSVLLEGGSELAASALKAGIVDEVQMIVAPKILGGTQAVTPVGGDGIRDVARAISLDFTEIRPLGEDVLLTAHPAGAADETGGKEGGTCSPES